MGLRPSPSSEWEAPANCLVGHRNYYQLKTFECCVHFPLSPVEFIVKISFAATQTEAEQLIRQRHSEQSTLNITLVILEPPTVPPGYMFRDVGEQSDGICYRDVTSPINELDGQSHSSRGEKHPITTGKTAVLDECQLK